MIEKLLKEIERVEGELAKLRARKHYGNLTAKLISRFEGRKNGLTFALELAEEKVVVVSNGCLKPGSVERIESFVKSQIQGSDNYSKFSPLEAKGEESGNDGRR